MLSKILGTQTQETELEEDKEIASSRPSKFYFQKENTFLFTTESFMTVHKHRHMGRALNRVHHTISNL